MRSMLLQIRRQVVTASSVLLIAACGGDGTSNPVTTTDVSSLTISVPTLNMSRGATESAILSIVRSAGYTGTVTFTAEGTPSGITVSFSPASLTGTATQSTMSVVVTQAAAPGTYNVTIRAKGSGSDSKTSPLTIVVATPSIGVTAAAGTAAAPQGQSTTVGITVSRAGGFTGDITLAAEGLPTGVTASFAPTVLTGSQTTSTLTLTTTNSAVVTTTPITIRATGVGVDPKTAVVQFSVTASTTPSVSLSAAPTTVPIVAGQSGQSTITIGRSGGFAGSVTLSVDGAPTGVTVSFAPNGTTGNTSVLTINTTSAATRGALNLTVRATGTGIADALTVVTAQINDPPGIGFTLTNAAQSIAAGANAANTLTLARLGGFAGDVTLTVTGLPAGVTTNLPATITANTSSVPFTITVPSNITPGVYPILISGSGAGGLTTQSTLTLTVTPAPGVSLVATPATLSIAQGGNGQSSIAVNRTGGFAGTVNLTITGLPGGITPTFNLAAVPNGTATSQLTLAVGGAVPAGTYDAVVRANATGLTEVTTPLTVTVTAVGGTAVAWRFCDDVPIWFGFRDGTGAWTRVTPSANNTFNFSISQPTGGVTYVRNNTNGGADVRTFYMTSAELVAQANAECANFPDTRNLTGTIAGVDPLSQTASVSVGGANAVVSGGSYTVSGVPNRTVDVLGVRNNYNLGTSTLTPLNAILRRNQTFAANAAIPLMDFGGAEAFALGTSSISLLNTNDENVSLFNLFRTANGSVGSIFFGTILPDMTTTRTIYGIPSNKTAAGDFHQLVAVVGAAASQRIVSRSTRDLATGTITFGPELTAPTYTTLATSPYARVRVTGNWMAEYGTAGSVLYLPDQNSWTISFTRGFTGAGATYQIDVPDLSGAGGFLSTWGLVAGMSTPATVSFTDATTSTLSEGLVWRQASRRQNITP